MKTFYENVWDSLFFVGFFGCFQKFQPFPQIFHFVKKTTVLIFE